jgi:hypothetical protein
LRRSQRLVPCLLSRCGSFRSRHAGRDESMRPLLRLPINDNDDAAVNHAMDAGSELARLIDSTPACDYFRVREMYTRLMEMVVNGLVECLTASCVNHDLSQAPKPSCPAPPAPACRPLHRIRLASASAFGESLRSSHLETSYPALVSDSVGVRVDEYHNNNTQW